MPADGRRSTDREDFVGRFDDLEAVTNRRTWSEVVWSDPRPYRCCTSKIRRHGFRPYASRRGINLVVAEVWPLHVLSEEECLDIVARVDGRERQSDGGPSALEILVQDELQTRVRARPVVRRGRRVPRDDRGIVAVIGYDSEDVDRSWLPAEPPYRCHDAFSVRFGVN